MERNGGCNGVSLVYIKIMGRVCGEIRDPRWGGKEDEEKEEFNVDIYRRGNLSLAEFTARTSLIEVILGRTTTLLPSLLQSSTRPLVPIL